MAALGKALPRQPQVRVTEASVDENRLLVWAGSDTDPGQYFVFDRTTHELMPFSGVRPPLANMPLATVKPVEYPAADGAMVPGYLTMPVGTSGKHLPAIVLPHGGPAARDEWGFDWLSQYYAARGFAVLQPNFRGSSGYGDAWFKDNGFKSWRTAIGDVDDAGKWLIAQGIADPGKLAIVGWSYGGYAALQSAVVDPGLFKAVVAIAPVTDLAALKQESLNWSNHNLVTDYVGDGPHIREGSPAQNARAIKVPVLIFHAELDRNVSIAESRLMDGKLKAAGVPHELVTWPKLDHYLDDSDARATMLRKSDAFLRASMGM
jgi:dipeptidyl aminopeptidase/acylaminoacyl peptidase